MKHSLPRSAGSLKLYFKSWPFWRLFITLTVGTSGEQTPLSTWHSGKKETAFFLFLSPDVLWGAACHFKQKEMRKPATTYPRQWVNIDFGVKQLVIVIILQIPLLHNTIYIRSITNKSCNIKRTSYFHKKHFSANAVPQSRTSFKVFGANVWNSYSLA